MSSAFERIAEERIGRAAAGEFDHLPGAGRPLDLGDEPLVPDEVRMVNRILKNAGCLPPELEALKAAREEASRPDSLGDDVAQRAARRRLAALHDTLASAGRLPRSVWCAYGPQLLARFAGRK